MNAIKRYLALLCSVLLLAAIAAGCGTAAQKPEETVGTTAAAYDVPETTDTKAADDNTDTTAAPADTTAPAFQPSGTELDAAALEELKPLFEDYSSWYSRATTSCYQTPDEVHLGELFHNGIESSQSELSEAEMAFLKKTFLNRYVGEYDICKLSASEMDVILQKYFGITMEETRMRGLESEVYWDETDSYYHKPAGSNARKALVHSAYQQSDGTIAVYYSYVGYYVHEDRFNESEAPSPDFVMTLQPTDDGYLIVSNWFVI